MSARRNRQALEEYEQRRAAEQERQLRARLARNATNLYAIACGDVVKFGIAINPKHRMCELQISAPLVLELLGFVSADYPLETEVHHYCAAEHVRGEWFRREGRAKEIEALIVAGDPLAIYSLFNRVPLWERQAKNQR